MRIRCALLTLAILATACGDGEGGTAAINENRTRRTRARPLRPGDHHGRATNDTTEQPPPRRRPLRPSQCCSPARGGWDRHLDLGDRQADVYYPAIPEPDAQTEIFDSLSVFPAELQAFIPSELTGEFDTTAYRDALVANDEQAFPVVAYSHGFGGFRQAATFHTSHIASWGFVVVTTDHIERGIAAQATGTLGGGAENQDVLDVLNAFDALAAHPELGPVSDLDRVAIPGHSAGGGTSARAAGEDVIDAHLSIGSGHGHPEADRCVHRREQPWSQSGATDSSTNSTTPSSSTSPLPSQQPTHVSHLWLGAQRARSAIGPSRWPGGRRQFRKLWNQNSPTTC